MSLLDDISVTQIVLIGLSICLLVLGVSQGGYGNTQSIASVRCLSCMGLEMAQTSFPSEFWVQYPSGHPQAGKVPEHPDWVKAESTSKVVILFFWGIGCTACEAQWAAMSSAGLVSGSEGNYKSHFPSYVSFHSIDSGQGDNRNDLAVYDPDGGGLFIPQTTVIFSTPDGTVHWVSVVGTYPTADLLTVANYADQSMG